jgi:hypothetical protein
LIDEDIQNLIVEYKEKKNIIYNALFDENYCENLIATIERESEILKKQFCGKVVDELLVPEL